MTIPPVNERQLVAFRKSLGEWASDIQHRRKPSGLALDLSRAHEAATNEPLDDRSIYCDLGNLRGLSAGTQNLARFFLPTPTAHAFHQPFPLPSPPPSPPTSQ